MRKQQTILIVSDMEGASGLTTHDQLRSGEGALALTKDIQAAVQSIRPFAKRIYIWDFDGDENNLKDEFGPKAKVLSHPAWEYLKSLHIDRVFLIGFHARAGLTQEFCPHTYSGADIRSFKVNGVPVGEATLFAHLFAQLNIPITFVSGSYYSCEELSALGIPIEKVPTRRGRVVYSTSVVRKLIAQKARRALHVEGRVIRMRNYQFDIILREPVARFFERTHLVIKSPRKIFGSSPRFDVLYRDFVNGIFQYWGDDFRL